jgi:hypothetical protein
MTVSGSKIVADMPAKTKGTVVLSARSIPGARSSLAADLLNSLYGLASAYRFSVFFERAQLDKPSAITFSPGDRCTWQGADESAATTYLILGHATDPQRLLERLDLGDQYA